ncbi:hypothetical protein [Chryseobacterium salviniae]|uniref:PH domain-containing protein n=1 Tax=Chryseobacterium salviniae TaxID=3101750 RepID=A0ABU6HPX2_9FLAO|nr:hypothetical protein [Chryseobacterium sp. T9W2-O]MEC3874135.1 hypothetical protein [Chryseobacterium sp. T9W2-O]
MTKIDKYIVFTIVNFVLFIVVVCNTVFNFYWFFITIVILVFIAEFLIRKEIIRLKDSDKKYFFAVTFPMIINLFFLINYITGYNAVKETYCFKNKIAKVGGRGSNETGKTTYIYLTGNAYEYSYMTRSFFIDYKRMLFKNQIIYTFERGIFGLKIRKDYDFVYSEECLEKGNYH